MKHKLTLIFLLILAAPLATFAQFNAGGIQQVRTSNNVQWKNASGTNIAMLDNETPRFAISGQAQYFSFAYTTDATTNGVDITVTAKDGYDAVVPYAIFDFQLSDTATGLGLTVTTASGSAGTLSTTGNASGTCDLSSIAGFTAVSNANGSCLGTLTTKKAFHVQANSAGQWVLQLIDSAKTLFYPVAITPTAGIWVGTRLTAANYK